MPTILNSYASNVYSEHSLATWPLDDDVSFISLITADQRKFTNWTLSNCTASNNPSPLPDIGSPFNSNIYSAIIGNVPSVDGQIIEAISPGIFSFNQLSQYMQTFSLNMYLYQDSVHVEWYEIGFRYYDNFEENDVDIVQKIIAPENKGWINFNFTFDVPEFDSDLCYLIIRSSVVTGGAPGDYNFIVNGLSVGQWSENTSSKSLGVHPVSLPESCNIDLKGVESEQYGVLSENAYYIVDEDNSLLAKNEGIPMVFGSQNVTKIYSPSDNFSPSFIFPGKGMLSEYGRYLEYTLEFWLKIDPRTKNERRILGPIDSDYGLYVSEGFLSLLIENKIISHNVSNWYRPMLIHIVFKNDSVLLVINGEQVGQLIIDRQTMTLPKNNSWWGFYSYNDINIFEIDCISIMPYILPLQVAKRRFVWGQGVENSEIIDQSFKGESAYISFPNAEYTTNKIYPDIERWDASYYNNLIATKNSISVPNYSLPSIILGGRDINDWYEDNKIVNNIEYPFGYEYPYYGSYNFLYSHNKFFTFRPNVDENGEWVTSGTNWNEQCYLNFSSMSFLNKPINSIYGIFEIKENTIINVAQPLIVIINSINNKKFEINLITNNLGQTEVLYKFDNQQIYTQEIISSSHFAVGFNIPAISSFFAYELASFFGSPEFLQIYIGGDGTTTFEGKIYRIGFSDISNFEKISDNFNDNGIVKFDTNDLLEMHYATYTLQPFVKFNRFFLDISISAEWEEYYPLSYFASYVKDRSGNNYYDFDYLQFNIGYPSLQEKYETLVQDKLWNYDALWQYFNIPAVQSYSMLDDENISGYVLYEDLETKLIIENKISTDESSMQMYATFQLLAEGANEPLKNFTYSQDLTDSFVIDAEDQYSYQGKYSPYLTKYSIVDGTIIYPPRIFDFEQTALVLHFNIEQDAILSKPFKITSLEICSKALNKTGLTPINTSTGNKIYPYTKHGIYYGGKEKNPLLIYKDDTPYLYLTKSSGIQLLYQNSNAERGILFPINNSKNSLYKIGVVQLFMKYETYYISDVEKTLFEVNYKNGTIEFFTILDKSEKRGIIYARDKNTRKIYDDISYYQNGIKVKNPTILNDEWNSIGVSFNTPLPCESYTGSINLFSGPVFNNVAAYDSNGLNEYSYVVPRPWSKVLFNEEIDPSNNLDWLFWTNYGLDNFISWKQVYILDEDTSFNINASNIYEQYIGTNIKVIDDNTGFSIEEDDFSIFAETNWIRYSAKPV